MAEREAFEQKVTHGVTSTKLRSHLLERRPSGYVHEYTRRTREFWLAALDWAQGNPTDNGKPKEPSSCHGSRKDL